jgi:hypothetical protein
MKLSIILILAVATFTVFLGNQPEVSAKESEPIAKCAMPNFQKAYTDSKTIFVGKVLSIKQDGDAKILKFQVEKYWKSKVKKTVEVRYYETFNYEVWLKVGKRYLVYAKDNEDGTLSDGRCSLTKNYSEAKDDLKKLGKGKIPR